MSVTQRMSKWGVFGNAYQSMRRFFSVKKKVGLRPTWNGGYESVAPFRVVSVNANAKGEETIDFAQNIESMIWQDKGVRIEFWGPRSPTESDVCVLIVSLHMTVLAKLHEQLESKAENWKKWNPLNFTGKSFVESEYYLKYFSALISANGEMESDSWLEEDMAASYLPF